MLAGIRQIAYALATAMAGFLIVVLAQLIWAALFRADAIFLFTPPVPAPFFGNPSWMVGHYEAFIGVGVVMWLIGYAIRRVARSMSSGHPA